MTEPTDPTDPTEPTDPVSAATTRPGQAIVTAALVGTVVFVVAAAAGLADPDGLAIGTAVVSIAMFVIGCTTFLWAFAIAVGRSRTDEVTLAGVYFLSAAPTAARARLLGALAVQILVALTAGIVRIYTPVAFVALAPMFGLGLAGLWGARHATFLPRRRI
ncbi:MAG: hypothetical protein ACRD0A_17470 [Acidimicrobiales bacterium]